MINLNKFPFVRLVLPYGVGIWLAYNTRFTISETAIMVAIISLMLALLIVFFFVRSYANRWYFGLLLTLLLIGSGIGNVTLNHEQRNELHLLHDTTVATFYQARVFEPPLKKEKTTRIVIELLCKLDSNAVKPINGLVLVYLNNEGLLRLPAYGDIIGFSKKPQIVENPVNPAQFDYKTYLERKGIFHQIFLKEGDWWIGGRGYQNPLFQFAYFLRDRLLSAMQTNGLDGDEFAVAAAILLGYDDALPVYLRKGYTSAGAMHILCVSGLHVGIIFLIFDFIFKILLRGKHKRFIKTLLLLVIVWFYAIISGLSPSVQRATIMISFMLFGQLMQRKGFIVNSLAASAFLLLWMDPATLFHIGFQLSYLAVLGIVLLQKPIFKLLYLKNKALNKTWEISSVAIAAQLGTTPVVLYYFHQFPTYFLLSNLLLVPLSFAVIVSGMALLLTSFLPLLPQVLGWTTSGLIFIMNYLILWVEQIPYSVFKGLYINSVELLLLMVLLILLMFIFSIGIKKWAITAVIGIVLLVFTSFTWRNYQQNKQSKMIIYGLNRVSAINFIHGKNHVLVADTVLEKDAFMLGFHLEKNWVQNGLTDKPKIYDINSSFKNEYIVKNESLISFNGKLIAIYDRKSKTNCNSLQKIKVDYLVVKGNAPEKLLKLNQCYEIGLLVLDLSVPHWNIVKWETAAKNTSIPTYNIHKQGALVVNFN